uniref:uncharacterized protein LOC122597856 isoform X2 n=1 Tax=Erigeron canadensis TaxID=72917 RepID=UPI001CB9B110|nr:uncharacterized protein LOC122597856 isoform X2 [Erigeron canadensis]XP_043626373.1 uncharacterized protein LOC122597856 isoform X2 [Erigeron canadensis]
MADKQIAAAEATPDDNFPRKDKQAAAAPTDIDFPYKPTFIEWLQKTRDKYKWDPELLKVSADDFKRLPYEQRRKWIIAHFLLREFNNAFKEEYYHEMDEDEKDLFN